jgi:flagellar hook-basal body complex protein FliE
MAFPAITAVAGVSPTFAASALAPTTATSTDGSAFAASLGSSIDSLQGVQANADNLAVQASTGSLENVHDYTIAASEAKLSIELTSAVRNKALEAFTEIMRMQA